MRGGYVWLYLEKASAERPKYSPDHWYCIETKTEVTEIPLKGQTPVSTEYVHPFHYAYGDDQQISALAKCYFMLAAHQNHLGFSRHTIPVNKTFVDALGKVLQKVHLNRSKLTTEVWGLYVKLPPISLPNQVSQPFYKKIDLGSDSVLGGSMDDDEMDIS
jgi:hypothetical protein